MLAFPSILIIRGSKHLKKVCSLNPELICNGRMFLKAPADLTHQDLGAHFARSRQEFYSAESLRTFSRDTLPPGEFERLQDEVHDGIRDEVRLDHPSGYHRVVTVVKTARALDLGGHPLHTRMTVRDRGGVCHQLVNDGRVRWVK